MRTDTSQTIYRSDYTPPSFLVDTVELGFDLHPERTVVANRVTLRQNPASKLRDIVLHGEEITLVQLRMNGKLLKEGDYVLDHATLTIKKAPAQVVLEIETLCAPVQNTTLSGRSGKKVMRRKPSASHCVKKLPPDTYRPDSVVFAAGLQMLVSVSSNWSGTLSSSRPWSCA